MRILLLLLTVLCVTPGMAWGASLQERRARLPWQPSSTAVFRRPGTMAQSTVIQTASYTPASVHTMHNRTASVLQGIRQGTVRGHLLSGDLSPVRGPSFGSVHLVRGSKVLARFPLQRTAR
jgi:hypothetical protein